MSDDEATMAHQRLWRLFEPTPAHPTATDPQGLLPVVQRVGSPVRPAPHLPPVDDAHAGHDQAHQDDVRHVQAHHDDVRHVRGRYARGGHARVRHDHHDHGDRPDHPAGPGGAAGHGHVDPDELHDHPGHHGDGADGPVDPPAARWPGPDAFDPGRRGVRVLAVVGVLVVLGAGVWAWRARPQAEPVAPSTTATLAVPEASAEPTEPSTDDLVVAVAGKVRRPGLVRVPAGARVADAVAAAGGVLPGVDLALLNPARKVADGELVLVGVTPPPGQPAAPAAGGAPGAAGQPGGAAPGGLVNLNTATLAQLDGLPGVGPVLAQRILDHRERHGGFRTVGDLRQVSGIGDARYEQLKELVTV
ncbi:ComEA family DNA-binding protein [Micromonospora rosaria]|uniref:ComEA family DNA-binding protein n=1 Tax=Micromonospora rosaria TaxID=47874 RepID=UPI001FDFAB56|nr:ComEA family DNA-binding protein [Micromonospora rosaria]